MCKNPVQFGLSIKPRIETELAHVMQQLVDDIDDSEHICDGAKSLYAEQIRRILKEVNDLVNMVNLGATDLTRQPQMRIHRINSPEELEEVFRKIFGAGF